MEPPPPLPGLAVSKHLAGKPSHIMHWARHLKRDDWDLMFGGLIGPVNEEQPGEQIINEARHGIIFGVLWRKHSCELPHSF